MVFLPKQRLKGWKIELPIAGNMPTLFGKTKTQESKTCKNQDSKKQAVFWQMHDINVIFQAQISLKCTKELFTPNPE